jgi:hypothetical protein
MPFFIIAGIVKTPWFKGKFGEFLANLSARCLLDKRMPGSGLAFCLCFALSL